MTKEKAEELIHIVYDHMKKYIALQGGNVVQKFREHDYQRDGVMNREELMEALNKLGIAKVEKEWIDAIFYQNDPYNKGNFPYYDFLI